MNRIAVVGNYLPRRCGIATFTTDLCESFATEFPQVSVSSVPVNDTESGYRYPARVRFELVENDPMSYRQAADFLNINKFDVVCLQHEFGIYGGPSGSHVLSLIRDLRSPVVSTLHTIPHSPKQTERQVLIEVADRSDRLIVMSRKGAEFLQGIYGVPERKMDLIPHGIHDAPFADPNFYKDHFGLEGRTVILNFGLLSRRKGIEYIIQALPEVVEKHPNATLVVVGATHPNVIRAEGEDYRLYLQRMARELNVEKNVILHNRFVDIDELIEFLNSADIYINSHLTPDQITSGTLAYALGAGKAVISTPCWYAEELLSDGAGILVPFESADATASAILELLDNETERHAMRKAAYVAGRNMIWPEVARQYMRSFEQACQDRCDRPSAQFSAKTLAEGRAELPEVKLGHLRQLTDTVGLVQHAIGTVPNYAEGYATDDNARGLVLTVLLEELGKEWVVQTGELSSRYLAFLWYAFDQETGRFRNLMSYDRRWLELVGSEDSHGRAVWGLGTALGRSYQKGLCQAAGRLFELVLPALCESTHLRPTAYALLGLHEYLRRYSGDRAVRRARSILAKRLFNAYERSSAYEWPWFEDELSYANATLPHALILSGRWIPQPSMVRAGLDALDWLARIQTSPNGHFAPIGNNGFYHRNGDRAHFDQQPIEGQALISACIEAYHATSDERWKEEAHRVFEWFLGRNDLGVPLYDPTDGGCSDGLGPQGANMNRGAESTLAFLLSLAELRLLEHDIAADPEETRGDVEVRKADLPLRTEALEVGKP